MSAQTNGEPSADQMLTALRQDVSRLAEAAVAGDGSAQALYYLVSQRFEQIEKKLGDRPRPKRPHTGLIAAGSALLGALVPALLQFLASRDNTNLETQRQYDQMLEESERQHERMQHESRSASAAFANDLRKLILESLGDPYENPEMARLRLSLIAQLPQIDPTVASWAKAQGESYAGDRILHTLEAQLSALEGTTDSAVAIGNLRRNIAAEQSRLGLAKSQSPPRAPIQSITSGQHLPSLGQACKLTEGCGEGLKCIEQIVREEGPVQTLRVASTEQRSPFSPENNTFMAGGDCPGGTERLGVPHGDGSSSTTCEAAWVSGVPTDCRVRVTWRHGLGSWHCNIFINARAVANRSQGFYCQ